MTAVDLHKSHYLTLAAVIDLSHLFVSHDPAVVREVAHDIVVMREARVEEHGPASRC